MPQRPPDVVPEIVKGDLSEELLQVYLSGPDLAVDTETMGLETRRDRPHGGEVTYLAKAARPVLVQLWEGRLDSHPLRLAYAEPGGPAGDLAWAQSVLGRRGLVQSARAEQVRSWK